MTISPQLDINAYNDVIWTVCTFPGTQDQIANARRVVSALWERHQDLDGLILDDLLLLVSELVSNAIRHTRSGQGGRVTLVIVALDSWTHVEVIDDGSPHIPRVMESDESTMGGRGLAIVDHIASRWGHYQDLPSRRAVWFEMGAA
ncbi:ATP-binding protein [Spongiactinospora rosea]|uniref:ATP-binding protein n=1 Tax=Spongiactinospora rosea TaxID=2248750 RepID=A0A366M5F3_9ACTN|nr:ATP-binding protein [Spongiactinospora rosea]RBQ20824.1 ATP-binding protein [Spongiactinospora rosea]